MFRYRFWGPNRNVGGRTLDNTSEAWTESPDTKLGTLGVNFLQLKLDKILKGLILKLQLEPLDLN